MKRRQFIRQSIAGTAGLSLAGLQTFAVNPVDSELTILHTNDMHSRIDPFPQDGGRYAGMGGMARRAELIGQIRAQQDNVLLLDAGDIFQGTPYFNLFGGELEFRLMSQMKYDAATLGNHDFDNGIEGLIEQLPHAIFPFVIANYDFSRTPLNNRFTPYRIFQKKQLKVGVFGLGIELDGLVAENLYGATRYQDPIPIAREMVQQLRGLDCHLVICLSHLGYRYNHGKVSDQRLANEVSGIDLIIGGHTHTFLDQPEAVTRSDGHTTLINQVGFGGINLGRIDFKVNSKYSKLTPTPGTVKVAN